MSSDNASSAVTYTSISSDSNRLSWGIPLVNSGSFWRWIPTRKVAQQRQAPPLTPANVPDPLSCMSHGFLTTQMSLRNYDEDPRDPEEDHTNDPVDGEDGDDEPFNDDIDDEDEEPTEVKEEEEHIASATHLRRARKTVRLEPPMSASMEARIASCSVPIPPQPLPNDQAPPSAPPPEDSHESIRSGQRQRCRGYAVRTDVRTPFIRAEGSD
ncbi:hypothetical protein Tco_0215365 [Tanacetum coccineum]